MDLSKFQPFSKESLKRGVRVTTVLKKVENLCALFCNLCFPFLNLCRKKGAPSRRVIEIDISCPSDSSLDEKPKKKKRKKKGSDDTDFDPKMSDSDFEPTKKKKRKRKRSSSSDTVRKIFFFGPATKSGRPYGVMYVSSSWTPSPHRTDPLDPALHCHVMVVM